MSSRAFGASRRANPDSDVTGGSAGAGSCASRRAVAASSSGRASGRSMTSGSGRLDDGLPSASSRTNGFAALGSIGSGVAAPPLLLMSFPHSTRGVPPV